METESMTQNTEGKDKAKRVTSAVERLEKSSKINTGIETVAGTSLPSTEIQRQSITQTCSGMCAWSKCVNSVLLLMHVNRSSVLCNHRVTERTG